MDRQSPLPRAFSRRLGPWPAAALAVALAGCSNYRPSDALSALREAAPVSGFSKAVSQETTALGGLIQDSMPVYIGTTAKSFLKHVQSSRDPNIRYLAYTKLGDPDLYDGDPKLKEETVSALVAKLTGSNEPLATRAVIIRTLGALGDARARDAIARSINDPEALVRAAACRALGKVGRPEDATVLVRVMTVDMVEDCRIAAIEGIGALKTKDPRVHQVLIEGMDHEDPAIRLSCYRALKEITGKDVGNTPGPWRRELLGQSEPSAAEKPRDADATKEKPSSGADGKGLAKAPSSSWSRPPASPAPRPAHASTWTSTPSSAPAPAGPGATRNANANTNVATNANATTTNANAAANANAATAVNSAAPTGASTAASASTSAAENGSALSRLSGAFSKWFGR